jgi:hypothetical protein
MYMRLEEQWGEITMALCRQRSQRESVQVGGCSCGKAEQPHPVCSTPPYHGFSAFTQRRNNRVSRIDATSHFYTLLFIR